MKMNKVLLAIGIAILIYLGFSTFDISMFGVEGSGIIIEESFDAEIFNSVKAGGVFQIVYSQGSNPSVTIKTDDNILPLIEVLVEEGELILSCKNRLSDPTKIIATIVSPGIERIDLSGASKFVTEQQINASKLEIELSGASSSKVNVNAESLIFDLSGASSMEVEGGCKKLTIESSGASDINCLELNTEDVSVDCSGASKVSFLATKSINIEASGASEIKYISDNFMPNISISGAATISKIK